MTAFIKKITWLSLLALASFSCHASIDQDINQMLQPLSAAFSNFVFYKIDLFGHGIPIIVMWLAAAALFFTVYLGFINIRAFPYAIKLVRGDYANKNDPGEVSHFKALTTAISGTVGIGNIAGVAVAIGLGGPGAAFWIFFAGFLAMSTKLVECTLGVKYRRINADGSVSGGPMYYLQAYFTRANWPKLGKGLGRFYALALVIGCFGIGNMFQSNQAYVQIVGITGGDNSFFADKGWLFGLMLALVVGAVIIGGIRSIANVTSKIVPFMAVLYMLLCVVVITMSSEHIPNALAMVIEGAFTMEGASGGAVGALIIGFQRALFSNEAGLGSAPIAHAAVQTKEPASEGIVSLLEPFIDTLVICTLTSLVILTTAYPAGLMESGLQGIALSSAAFEHHLSWAPYPLAIAALLFALSTAISWSYYGMKGWTYLFGESKRVQNTFKFIFCFFIMLGCMTQLSSVLDFSDAIVFLIAVPNILALYLFAPEVKKEVNEYLARLKAKDAQAAEDNAQEQGS